MPFPILMGVSVLSMDKFFSIQCCWRRQSQHQKRAQLPCSATQLCRLTQNHVEWIPSAGLAASKSFRENLTDLRLGLVGDGDDKPMSKRPCIKSISSKSNGHCSQYSHTLLYIQNPPPSSSPWLIYTFNNECSDVLPVHPQATLFDCSRSPGTINTHKSVWIFKLTWNFENLSSFATRTPLA